VKEFLQKVYPNELDILDSVWDKCREIIGVWNSIDNKRRGSAIEYKGLANNLGFIGHSYDEDAENVPKIIYIINNCIGDLSALNRKADGNDAERVIRKYAAQCTATNLLTNHLIEHLSQFIQGMPKIADFKPYIVTLRCARDDGGIGESEVECDSKELREYVLAKESYRIFIDSVHNIYEITEKESCIAFKPTGHELKLLIFLLKNIGRVCTHGELKALFWTKTHKDSQDRLRTLISTMKSATGSELVDRHIHHDEVGKKGYLADEELVNICIIERKSEVIRVK
jgi:DNA-binding winged helix-turn-helix (wHTH) protein